VNLSEALANDPLNRRDRIGLELTESQCNKAVANFYVFNPAWKDKIDYWDRQPGNKRCELNLTCECCPPKGDTQRVMADPWRLYNVRICRNNQDSANIYETIAHELTHFFANCADMDDKFDCTKEDGQGFFDCHCAKSLCKEIQAFRKSRACRTDDECWEILKSRKYLEGPACSATPPYTAPTRTRIWKFMGQCKEVDIPNPHYPHPVPDL